MIKITKKDEASSLRHVELSKADKYRLAANKICTKSDMYTNYRRNLSKANSFIYCRFLDFNNF